MELSEVMRTTPATRAFVDAPVPDRVVYRILDRARFAPSGGNRQGWRVIKVDDPDTRRQLKDLYVLSWREYAAHRRQGLVPFAPSDHGQGTRPAVDLDEARRTPAPHPFADNLDRVPVLLVVCVELAALAVTDNGLGRQSVVGGASIYPFTHNILLAARDEGYGGVMTTVICRQEPAVKALLAIPDGFAVASLMALGRPEREVTALSRRPVEEFVFVDRFGGQPFAG